MDSILALRQRDAPFRAPRQPHSIQILFAQDTDVEASPVLSTKNWIAPIFDPSLGPFAAKQLGRSKQCSSSAGDQQPYHVSSRHSSPLNHQSYCLRLKYSRRQLDPSIAAGVCVHAHEKATPKGKCAGACRARVGTLAAAIEDA